jgi:trehalose 6-phosphate phosphatase
LADFVATDRNVIIICSIEQLPSPPRELLRGATLFLDLDGTLLDLANRPDEVVADPALRRLLDRLIVHLDGRVALVSGRSLEQIDRMFGATASGLAVSGSHGCEHRWRGICAQPDRPASLDRAAAKMRAFATGRSGLLVEEKSFGVALHYRSNPSWEAAVQDFARSLAEEFGLTLQIGKMVAELRVGGGDKGRAVHRLMTQPSMRYFSPVFVGDDVTDEPGFATARALGGHGIIVGAPQSTAADYRLGSPADVRNWLAEAIR